MASTSTHSTGSPSWTLPVPPVHPVPALQAAFSDSFYTNLHSKHTPKTHTITQLLAQLSFGLHLLHTRTALSVRETIHIMQTHVSSIDDFLRSSQDELVGCTEEVRAQIAVLEIPCGGGVGRIFDEMLGGAAFRKEILDANEEVVGRIEEVSQILRTRMEGVTIGMEGAGIVLEFMEQMERGWNAKMEVVYKALRRNVEQWMRCFVGLQTKGTVLGKELLRLKAIVREVEMRVLKASWRTRNEMLLSRPTLPRLNTSPASLHSSKKPLPSIPSITPVLFEPPTPSPEPLPALDSDHDSSPSPGRTPSPDLPSEDSAPTQSYSKSISPELYESMQRPLPPEPPRTDEKGRALVGLGVWVLEEKERKETGKGFFRTIL